MVRFGDPIGPLAIARSMFDQGLTILPAARGQKAPYVPWQKLQAGDRPNPSTWFKSSGNSNYWCLTGRSSGVVVIDCDNQAAETYWRDEVGLGELMDATTKVRTTKGFHYYFRIPEDWNPEATIKSFSVHPTKDGDPESSPSFDVRADGGGVIVPPSIHESGRVYRWETPLSAMRDAPQALLDGTYQRQAHEHTGGSDVPGEGQKKDASGVTRSMLIHLLQNIPNEGRNVWLSKVAGHYAKQYHGQRDLYDYWCADANAKLPEPLDDAEYAKTINSIWKSEHANNPQRALDATCGFLQGTGVTILTQVANKDEEGKSYDMEEWADFDLIARGVMLDDEQSRTYWVEIRRNKRAGGGVEVIDAVLPAGLLGDDRALRKWFARFACTINPPMAMYPPTGTPGLRLQRYLESQNPAAVVVTSTLGWDQSVLDGAGGYVTHEGVITATEVLGPNKAGVRPNPALRTNNTAPHHYGFEGDLMEAKRVLREVMSFHFPETTSVFGAWWAACLLKPQIQTRTSLFPFVAIEAPSESGKTNGFFDQMTQLNGNTQGEMQPTKAALRDMSAAHRNGIVWVDDLDDPVNLMELLRAATSGGTLTKMGEDRTTVIQTQIVAPIVISGETLGIGYQKALLDRAVLIKVKSPTERKSVRNPKAPQWDDILAIGEKYPHGLSAIAGWIVQEALTVQDEVLDAVIAGRTGHSGRVADKIGILRAGARLMDFLISEDEDEALEAWTGAGSTATGVEDWITAYEEVNSVAGENTLTLQILPWALRTFEYPTAPVAPHDQFHIDSPVFVKGMSTQAELGSDDNGMQIWFSPVLLAQAYEREYRGRVERRTQTETALKDQADVLNATSKRWKIGGGGNRTAYYRKIEGDVARKILERALGQI